MRITFCFGTIPSDLTLLTTVLPLGRNAWLDLLGEGVTILIDENNIAFISDPQLRSEKAQKLAAEIIGSGGFGIMTGTVERGSFSEELINSEKMITARYTVHQNYSDYLRLVNSNDLSRSIPYHTAEVI